uniref:Semaphorin 7A (JohnMiltonHagen blood group) n=1 Tax=Fundulus heteroclitus TaxID=8078 RepID=A0A3Q2P262_FUNHE
LQHHNVFSYQEEEQVLYVGETDSVTKIDANTNRVIEVSVTLIAGVFSQPTFISASWVERENDPENEKIYVFFREKNSDHSPDADPWISRVARVCKTDVGGSKRFFQNMWTSFLKARLVCGFPDESLYFSRLQDVYVMQAEDCICVLVFFFFQCVPNSKLLPRAIINVVKDHPEMVAWVHSLHYNSPFYISNYNYTKIAVDRVQAADRQMYNVLLLATDTGKIHKVLEAGTEPFIISETQLSSESTIQAMKLDSKKKKLVVGFSEKISIVDLQQCKKYKNSCADCVLARDPYCAWTTSGYLFSAEKDLIEGSKRQLDSLTSSRTVHSVPRGVPFYLSCPIQSYHAEYTWEHEGRHIPCLQMHSNCLHLIPSMARENYGKYDCVSREKDYTKTLKQYQLMEQEGSDEKKDKGFFDHKLNDALRLVPQLKWSLIQTLVLWEIVR